jgi:hypothetical protein
MPNQGISIQVIGDDRGVQRALHALDTALNPVALAVFLGAAVEPWVKKRADTRFAQEGDDVSGPWKPLEQVTQNIRASQGFGAAHPINVRTGELERYITESQGFSNANALGATLTYPNSAPVGELHNKVKVAQAGGRQAGHRDTPARPVLGLGPQDLSFVLLALTAHVQKVGRAAGFR